MQVLKKVRFCGLIVIVLGYAQTERWVYTYNGPAGTFDETNSVAYGTDGNIYAGGSSTDTIGGKNFTVISLSSDGTERWVYQYNGPGNDEDVGAVIYGTDGNLYGVGHTTEIDLDRDLMVLSLTTEGAERWVYQYNGTTNLNDCAMEIIYGADGNLYIAGYSNSDGGFNSNLTVISLTNTGQERWVYIYPGPATFCAMAEDIVYGSDGNLYIAGSTGGTSDFTVISLTADGRERWSYIYNPAGGMDYGACSVIYGPDGNIYAAGESFLYPSCAFTVVSLTPDGTQRWIYTYDVTGIDHACDIAYGLDGNLYVAGYTFSGTNNDFTVISLTPNGVERWVYTYNGCPGYPNSIDEAYTIVCGLDSNIYAAGFSTQSSATSWDFTVISLTPSGNQRWIYTYNGPANNVDRAVAIAYGSDGNLYAAGDSYISINPYNTDFIVISLEAGQKIEEQKNPSSSGEFLSTPSLFRDRIDIKFNKPSQNPLKIILHNIYGACVYEKSYSYTPSFLAIQDERIANLSPGVYFLSVVSKEKNHCRTVKLIKP